MCFDYEPDQQSQEDEARAADEIRRLFDRYRSSRRHEAEELGDEAAEDAPVLAAR